MLIWSDKKLKHLISNNPEELLCFFISSRLPKWADLSCKKRKPNKRLSKAMHYLSRLPKKNETVWVSDDLFHSQEKIKKGENIVHSSQCDFWIIYLF